MNASSFLQLIYGTNALRMGKQSWTQSILCCVAVQVKICPEDFGRQLILLFGEYLTSGSVVWESSLNGQCQTSFLRGMVARARHSWL